MLVCYVKPRIPKLFQNSCRHYRNAFESSVYNFFRKPSKFSSMKQKYYFCNFPHSSKFRRELMKISSRFFWVYFTQKKVHLINFPHKIRLFSLSLPPIFSKTKRAASIHQGIGRWPNKPILSYCRFCRNWVEKLTFGLNLSTLENIFSLELHTKIQTT